MLLQDTTPRVSPLVLLKPGDKTPPLFIMPGFGDDVMRLSKFVNLIRSLHPIYGIQARDHGFDPQNGCIEGMADHYLEAITELQPKGPYVLVGFSFGGLPMLEVARRLRERGEMIALLAFLDTYPHSRYWSLRSWINVLSRRAKHHAWALTKLPLRRVIPRVGELLAGLVEHLRIRRGAYRRKRGSTVDIDPKDEALLVAWARFRPRYYPGKITFLNCEIATSFPDAVSVWGNLAAELEVYNVPGDHGGIVTSHAERAANQFSRCLGRALL
jgi:acetoacetyl-CoA synthetase